MIDNENRLVSRVEEVFNVWDYVLFGIMLAASCIIGRDPRTARSGTDWLIRKYKKNLSVRGQMVHVR